MTIQNSTIYYTIARNLPEVCCSIDHTELIVPHPTMRMHEVESKMTAENITP
jgi:hypothetical protein